MKLVDGYHKICPGGCGELIAHWAEMCTDCYYGVEEE